MKEGWGVIRPGDRRAHYYRDQDALCRKVGFYRGLLEEETATPSPDDCAGCRKKLDRERARAVASTPHLG
jgi:hypothetical protein